MKLNEVSSVQPNLPSNGLLQVFLSDSHCYYIDGWEPFSGKNLIRIIDPSGGHVEAPPSDASAGLVLPESRVDGWEVVVDHPSPDELEQLLHIDADTAFQAWDTLRENNLSDRSEKVGGWTNWVDEPQLVRCHRCSAHPMTACLQLEGVMRDLDVVHGNVLFVLRCTACGEMTAVQQRP